MSATKTFVGGERAVAKIKAVVDISVNKMFILVLDPINY